MKIFTIAAATVLSFLFVATPVFAQSGGSVELRGGVNVAVDQFAGTDLSTGSALEIGLDVRVAPALFVYGAWDWQNRGAKSPLFGATVDVEDTGYAFGLKFVAPGSSRAKPWLRAGGLWNHVEIENEAAGDLIADSEHTWGFEVGGGLDIGLSDRWSLNPGVRYRRFEPNVRFGGLESSATLSYVVIDVGVALKF